MLISLKAVFLCMTENQTQANAVEMNDTIPASVRFAIESALGGEIAAQHEIPDNLAEPQGYRPFADFFGRNEAIDGR